MTCFPAPMAKSVSVAVGDNEMMRVAPAAAPEAPDPVLPEATVVVGMAPPDEAGLLPPSSPHAARPSTTALSATRRVRRMERFMEPPVGSRGDDPTTGGAGRANRSVLESCRE